MRKEFEENEESKKSLENNLDMQDEIDDETFHRILREEFIEREKQVTEELFADEEVEDIKLTDKEVKTSYQELLRRYEREKKESMESSAELVPDESLLHGEASERKRVISIEEAREHRKTAGGGLHRLGKVVGMAVVCVVCVFVASMTSEANRKYLVNSVRIWSGDDTKMVVDNDDSNERANTNEDEAIANIEEKLSIEMPSFYYRPYGLEFSDYVIDTLTLLARIEYTYKENTVLLYIDKQAEGNSSNINSLHGENDIIYSTDVEGIEVVIEKIQSMGNDSNYAARWKVGEVEYLLSGKIELEELKKIIKNMKF